LGSGDGCQYRTPQPILTEEGRGQERSKDRSAYALSECIHLGSIADHGRENSWTKITSRVNGEAYGPVGINTVREGNHILVCIPKLATIPTKTTKSPTGTSPGDSWFLLSVRVRTPTRRRAVQINSEKKQETFER